MSGNSLVTWKWVAGSLLAVILAISSAFFTGLYGEVSKIKEEQKQDRQMNQDVKRDLDVIKERTRRTEEDVKELRGGQKEQDHKLDELLRRSR